jgi:hypothetical protein
MRCHLWKQYTVDELLGSERFEETDREALKLVRCYPVTSLTNAVFQVQTDNELGDAILKLLTEKLTGMDWIVKCDWQEPFRKYFIVHGSVPAPPDMLTCQPMALEIYCELASIDNVQLDSQPGSEWIETRRAALSRAQHFDLPMPEMTGKMVIAVKKATYANVMYPGIGVPLYF